MRSGFPPGAPGTIGRMFDDAWLTCELHAPRGSEGSEGTAEGLVDRTGRWCVTVLEAISAS